MKLTAAQVESFLRRPDPRAGAVLVYGPDDGLVRERVLRLIASVLDDLDDPFRYSELSADLLRSEPARLGDEARALTFTGGRRVVRVRQASDLVTPACRLLLEQQGNLALVVLDAGDLGPASSLRRLFEGGANAAALPCYHDQPRELGAVIDRLLAEHGLVADREARAYLTGHLGSDRGVTRAEVERLALYVAAPDGAPGRRRVSLQDVAAVIGDSTALGLSDLVDAAALSDNAEVERRLDRLLAAGEPPVRIVRALTNHLICLQRLGLEAEQGKPLDRLMTQMRPPIHFSRRDRVEAALRRWPPERAAAILGGLLEAELACKTTGYPAALIAREAARAVARGAARA